MSDCCEELKRELQALKTEVQALNSKFIPKAERENIVLDSIRRLFSDPRFLAVAGAAYAAKELAGGLTNVKLPALANQVFDAKRTSLEALYKGRTAFESADNALKQVGRNTNKIGELLNRINQIGGKFADLASKFGSLLAKLQPLFALLGVIGLLLSVAQLAGTLLVIFPRLNAIDARLDSFESGLSRSLGLIQQSFSRATRALDSANKANEKADIALNRALDAQSGSRIANLTANEANDRSLKALFESGIATQKSNDAITRANAAIEESKQATNRANEATNRANESNSNANKAINQSGIAASIANSALFAVQRLDRKFSEVMQGIDSRFNSARTELLREFEIKINPVKTKTDNLVNDFNSLNAKISQVDVKVNANRSDLQEVKREIPQFTRSPEFNRFKQDQANINTNQNREIENIKTGESQRNAKVDNQINQINQAITVINQIGTPMDTQVRQELNRLTDQQNKILLAITTLSVTVAALRNRQTTDLNQLKQNTSFPNLANAAATGNCRTTQPGGCSRRMIQEENNSLLDKINNASKQFDGPIQAAQLAMLMRLDNKMGNQLPGGLSGRLQGMTRMIAKTYQFLQIDRVLNVLTYWATLHNAMMLSNSVGQTLFSGIGNLLAVFGIGQIDSEGNVNPINVGAIVSGWTDSFFKQMFGAENYAGMKKEWRRFSRIYQAASNVVWSIQSIGYSIINILEVISSMNAKIGNALKSFGKVGEKAYGWFNPAPNYQNRFFTALERTEMVTSQIDSVASEVLSTQQTINQIGKLQEDLQKEIKQESGFKSGIGSPEALAQKAIEDQRKQASEGISLGVIDLIKPEG